MRTHSLRPRSTRVSAALWLTAFLLMAGAAIHQRLTGPTHPVRGHLEIEGERLRYRLPRSGVTTHDRRVELPAPTAEVEATLLHRRYPSDEPFRTQPMRREEGHLVGVLPAEPAAGKVEYALTVRDDDEVRSIPAGGRSIVLRFKDPVPLPVLLAHVSLMFLSMLVGVRAALAALAAHRDLRPLLWSTLLGLTVGGMILGPVVQEFAFGAFWTGWPLGYDLTDNKTLLMWLAWAIAAGVAGRRARRDERAARTAVLLAAVVMVGVYLVPHSLGGSELDYEALERGLDPEDAIRTGRTPD